MIRRLDNMRKLLLQLGKVHLTEDEILDYCDGLLKDDKETKSIATHLECCFRCREQVRGIQEVLSPSWATRPPWAFVAAYLQKVAAQTQFRSFFSQLRRAWAVLFPSPRRVAFASLLLILIVGLFLVIQIKKQPLEIQAQLVQPSAKGAPSTTPSIYYSGDRLRLSLKVTREAYSYVVLYDSKDKAQLLFPLAGIDLSNKLEPKRDYPIPSDDWVELDQNTGMETLFILASRQPESDVQNVVRFIEKEASTTKETYHERIKHVADILSDRGFVVRTISFEHKARE